VRIIAASNVDLERAVDEGRFRRDLFYRLSVFPITLPALRQRREDIHPLVIHFLEHYKQRTARFVSGISKAALRALISYDWPGNVRELENAVERAVIIASGRQIELDDFSTVSDWQPSFQNGRRWFGWSAPKPPVKGATTKLEIDVPSSMDEIERHAIEATLDYTSGDKNPSGPAPQYWSQDYLPEAGALQRPAEAFRVLRQLIAALYAKGRPQTL